jgi:hypothetical protein
MRIIEIAPLDNGAHRNQNGDLSVIPEGWAVVPADLETENFPFGEVTVDETQNPPVVTAWSPLPIPEPDPVPDPEPTQMDRIEAQVTYTAMMTDTLLEV